MDHINCEVGAEITDAQGTTLRDLKIGTEAKPNAYATAWVGNHCVLYEQMSDSDAQNHPEIAEHRLLNLRTSKSAQVGASFKTSAPVEIRSKGSDQYAVTEGKTWKLPEKSIAVIIGGWRPATIPHDCE